PRPGRSVTVWPWTQLLQLGDLALVVGLRDLPGLVVRRELIEHRLLCLGLCLDLGLVLLVDGLALVLGLREELLQHLHVGLAAALPVLVGDLAEGPRRREVRRRRDDAA